MPIKGRPRTFDLDQALDQALYVFGRKGYEGATMTDLTEAMGINPPSLYAAFGNKENLFRKAIDRYAKERTGFWTAALEAPTSRAMVEQLLHGTAKFLTDPSGVGACLLVQGTMACGEAAECVREELIARRTAGQAAIRKRLDRAKKEGDLPSDASAADLARYIGTVLDGMVVRASEGAGRKELLRTADLALRVWPTSAAN